MHVQQDEVGAPGVEDAQPFAAVRRVGDLVPGTLEQGSNQASYVGVVVDDEDAGALHTLFIPDATPILLGATDDEPMARVAIGEPYAEVRELLVRVVESAGWQAVVEPDDAVGADLVLVEPGDARSFELARRLRETRPELPVVCVSIYPAGPETDALSPTAYLVKPFSVGELQRVLAAALNGHASRPNGSATAALSHQTQ